MTKTTFEQTTESKVEIGGDEFSKIQNTLQLRDLKYKPLNKKSLIKNSLSFEEMRKIRSLRIDRLELEKTLNISRCQDLKFLKIT